MNIQFVPLDNWLIVKPRPAETLHGNLVLPEGENPIMPTLGDVLEAGPGRRNENGDILKMRVKKGDVVLLNGLSARQLFTGPGEFVIMLREHEIAAFVQPAPPQDIHQAIFPHAVKN